jgi:hypothetical protein
MASLSTTAESDRLPNIKRKHCANVALHFEKEASSPPSIIMPCERKGQFTSVLFKSGLTLPDRLLRVALLNRFQVGLRARKCRHLAEHGPSRSRTGGLLLRIQAPLVLHPDRLAGLRALRRGPRQPKATRQRLAQARPESISGCRAPAGIGPDSLAIRANAGASDVRRFEKRCRTRGDVDSQRDNLPQC